MEPTRNYGFLLVPNYSMIAFSSAVEPLRMANQISDQQLYHWQTLTLDGRPVTASNGLDLIPDCSYHDAAPLSALFICAGLHVNRSWSTPLQQVLRQAANKKIILGSLCTGSYLLARAGLLDGYRCTIHWEQIASMREQFPRIDVKEALFELDRDRFTCTGGSASLDMMLQLISSSHGYDLAASISEQFIWDRIRGHNDRQRIPLKLHLGTSQPKLTEAVTLMEANMEEPMSLEELSHHVGISRRQLERLFQKYLGCVPTRYYLELRLTRARQLLLQTEKSIVDVALACGFVSAPHFSKCYRDFFSITPRDERRLGGKSSQDSG